MKRASLYILNIFLITLVGFSILPDFSLNEKEFKKVTGLVRSIEKEVHNYQREKPLLFNNLVRERLIISIADRDFHEYYVSDIYQKYWEELLDPSVVGKEMTLYLGKGDPKEDPFRIDVDNKVIYSTSVRFYRNLLIIIFTLALSIYNLFHFFEPDQKNSNALFVRRSVWSRIKHYFIK